VGDILSELLLSTTREEPLGIAIALLDAFHQENENRTYALSVATSSVLRSLCDSWVTLIDAKLVNVECSSDDPARFLRNEVLLRLRALSGSICGAASTLSTSSHDAVVDLATILISVEEGTSSEFAGIRQRFTVTARRLGFWQSVLSTSEVAFQSSPHLCDNAFGVVGLGCLVDDARRVVVLLKRLDLFANCRWTNGTHIEKVDFLDSILNTSDCFTDLLETSCQLMCRDNQLSSDEELLAINHFRDHWRQTFSCSNESFGGCIALLSCILESLLCSEVAGGGWRTGHSGDGVTIETRLRNRMSVASDLIRKVPQFGWYIRSAGLDNRGGLTSQIGKQSSASLWYRYSSVEYEELGHAAAFVDHCTRHTAICSCGEALSHKEGVSRQNACGGISLVVKDIASLVTVALLERHVFLVVCSMRALILEVGKTVESCKQSVMVAAMAAINCLSVIPAPWGAACGARCDIAHDIMNALYSLRRIAPRVTSLSGELVLSTTHNWAVRMAQRMPGFVINLDRRRDRWRKFVMANERMGVNIIRVCAVDGSSIINTDFHDEDVSRFLNSLVPETDVSIFWDSTLNSQFDSGCMVNTHTPLTPAERACAASHLKVWRAIADIRARLGMGAFQRTREQAVDHVGVTSAGARGIDLMYSMYTMFHREAMSFKKQSLILREEFDYYLVFEDDAVIPFAKQAGFRKNVALLMHKLPSCVDILYLGGAVPKRASGFKSKFACDKLFSHVNYIWMLHAYVIRGRAVDVLLSNLPINSPVDNFIASLVYHEQLMVNPLICCFIIFICVHFMSVGFRCDE
jgi:GR25 family glycosyltransferase involved in LPS biosynthesis